MSVRLLTELITEQSFGPPKTAANETLKQAARAYRNGEMIKSANLFLEASRILQIEHQNYHGGRFELLPPWTANISKPIAKPIAKDLARESQERDLMNCCVLADLAQACLGSTGIYKFLDTDGYHSYTLNCYGLQNDKYGQLTTEDLDLEGKIWPRGSSVYKMFRLTDSMGFHIQGQDNFVGAAYSFACYGECMLEIYLDIGKEHSGFKKVIKEALTDIMALSKQGAKE